MCIYIYIMCECIHNLVDLLDLSVIRVMVIYFQAYNLYYTSNPFLLHWTNICLTNAVYPKHFLGMWEANRPQKTLPYLPIGAYQLFPERDPSKRIKEPYLVSFRRHWDVIETYAGDLIRSPRRLLFDVTPRSYKQDARPTNAFERIVLNTRSSFNARHLSVYLHLGNQWKHLKHDV